MSDKVSIIVPVYNVEKYLDECVKSILAQTYSNIEIVLVDDGSKDTSGSMCDEYKKQDNRIVVVHKENGGLSSARNAGMENASGDYYIFVDSDDTISPDMVEEMVKKAKEHDAKIVSSLISEEQDKLGKGNTGKVTVLNTHDALKSIFSDGLVVTSSSGKMYASDLWEDIRFPTDMIFEDFATIYKVIRKAPKVVSFEDWQYFYRPNPAGITGTPFYHRKMQFFDVAAKVSEGISDTHPDLVPVTVSGVVTSADGTPIGGVFVAVANTHEGGDYHTFWTDSRGQWTLTMEIPLLKVQSQEQDVRSFDSNITAAGTESLRKIKSKQVFMVY